MDLTPKEYQQYVEQKAKKSPIVKDTALAFVMQRPELVLFFGIVYIWDAMTVVIQRTYFKATHGKRIFRMTPIHHAFEMRGWREVKIDGFFALIAVIGVAMGIFYICVA